MATFPQLGTGAAAQYPLVRRRVLRTVSNEAPDGTLVKLADPEAAVTEWDLVYTGLSDDEASTIRTFFQDMEGRLGTFTFLDPAWNLLAQSEQLDHSVWQKDPLLTVSGGVADPWGTTRGWSVVNGGQAAQTLTQTLTAPAGFTYCLSLYVRSAGASTVRLIRDSGASERETSENWRRVCLTGSSESAAETVSFGIEVPASHTIEVFGMQVEAQTGASVYKRTGSQGGVYQGARFSEDVLKMTCTGVGRHECRLRVVHVNHS